jgi:hypothetical protein
MKAAAWIGLGILTVGNIVAGMVNTNYNQELKLKCVLSDAECRVLQGEVRQMEYKASTTQTYDEGYRDALIRMGGDAKGSYADGYAAAEKLYKGQSYTDGYHNAIGQFAASWSNPGEPKKEEATPKILPPK